MTHIDINQSMAKLMDIGGYCYCMMNLAHACNLIMTLQWQSVFILTLKCYSAQNNRYAPVTPVCVRIVMSSIQPCESMLTANVHVVVIERYLNFAMQWL